MLVAEGDGFDLCILSSRAWLDFPVEVLWELGLSELEQVKDKD